MPQITFNVCDKVFLRLEQEAKARGYSRSAYAAMLFEAAYAARCGATDDLSLRAKVEMVLVLWGAKTETAAIAAAVGLTESTVEKIMKAWRNATSGRPGGDQVRNEASARLQSPSKA